MKSNHNIALNDLIKMIQNEKYAQYQKYKSETESSLSRICESSEALGPLLLSQKLGLTRWKLTGDLFYSRFRPGDAVEIRTKKLNEDASVKFCEGWKVESVKYPSPGKIEVIISGGKLFDEDGVKEVFLFKALMTHLQEHLIKKIQDMPRSEEPILLGKGHFSLAVESHEFKTRYESLNPSQQLAIHHLIGNGFSGAIQGPPGTGKTQLLQAVIALALQSNMKVGIASLTHAAVDNLLGRITRNDFNYDWVRIGESEQVRKELYSKSIQETTFTSSKFSDDINEAPLIGATLHKLAYNKSAPKFDLLVIDEAGQVPVFFWPFIQRLCRRLIVVGDQFQLPPVLESPKKVVPVDNLFSLFIDNDTPMLETQYRMQREIQEWSSAKFYHGKLKPHVSVANRDYFSHHPAFMNDKCVVSQQFHAGSVGKYSQAEANFITDKVEKLVRGKDDLGTIGIICPYRAQAGIVNASLQNRIGTEAASKILVDTVERFQGQEREAIFFSCGASGATQEERRFLSDPRRLNVAVTRAKSRFYCLSDEMLFEKSNEKVSADLHDFLGWAKSGKTANKKTA